MFNFDNFGNLWICIGNVGRISKSYQIVKSHRHYTSKFSNIWNLVEDVKAKCSRFAKTFIEWEAVEGWVRVVWCHWGSFSLFSVTSIPLKFLWQTLSQSQFLLIGKYFGQTCLLLSPNFNFYLGIHPKLLIVKFLAGFLGFGSQCRAGKDEPSFAKETLWNP